VEGEVFLIPVGFIPIEALRRDLVVARGIGVHPNLKHERSIPNGTDADQPSRLELDSRAPECVLANVDSGLG
jgi:hypothetical protein